VASAPSDIYMPQLGLTMTEGKVLRWLKAPGDAVTKGEPVVEIETDKVTAEVEAPESGVLGPILAAEGAVVPIGGALSHVLSSAPTAAPAAVETSPQWAESASPSVEAPPSSVEAASAPRSGRARQPVTPRARRTAAELGVNLAEVEASGPGGRIVEADIRYYADVVKSESRKALLLGLYRTMLTIRRTEEQLVRMYAAGKIIGGCHTYIGEEAVATGVSAHLRPDDAVFSTHRGHGHALAKGLTPRDVIAELLGKATGCSGGRGGSMHLFKPEIGFMGSSGIVGPCITLAAGAAYTSRLLKLDRVSVAYFGDGASNNGSFHEGLNMATAWDLPVIFVCENNLYATEVPFKTVAKNPNVATRAQGYGLPGVEVDGNDVLAVHQAAGEAISRARAGNGPTLIECKTYRQRAHAEGMRDAGYRTADEVAEWKARDPIKRLAARMIEDGVVMQAELDAVDAEIRTMVEEATAFAEASPWPDPATVLEFVYSKECGRDA
jgi:TPP-dependent pyruvate/acetoin dehydrogenase alpha subunit